MIAALWGWVAETIFDKDMVRPEAVTSLLQEQTPWWKAQEVQMTVFKLTMCWLDVNALVVLVALKSEIAIRLILNSQELSDRDCTLAK